MVRNTYEVQNVGDLLREKRRQLGRDIKEVSEHTKIRSEYLLALETGNYEKFASDVYAKGFLKKYAKYLGISPDRAAAMYRRESSLSKGDSIKNTDYLSQKLSNSGGFVITPARIFTGAVVLLLLLFVVYLFSQISTVLREPALTISTPVALTAGSRGTFLTSQGQITISGQVELGSALTLNGSQVNVNNLQIFEITDLPLVVGENIFKLEARTQFGQTSEITLAVTRSADSTEPQTPPGTTAPQSPAAGSGTNPPGSATTQVPAVITVSGREAFVQVKADGNVALAQTINAGDGREVKFSNNLVLTTPRPDAVKVQIGEEVFQVRSSLEHTFTIDSSGQVTLSVATN
jgi:cytoskeletal protein RodZ